MRLKIALKLKKPEIDVEYRRIFLSLLKSSFENAGAEIFEKFYKTESVMKPFTFSVYLHSPKFVGDKISLKSNEVTLHFSTFSREPVIYLYNFLVKKRFTPYPLANDNELRFLSAHIRNERRITGEEIVFKTLSPFLVRLHNEADNVDRYLIPGEEGFSDRLKEINEAMFRELLGREESVDIIPVKLKKIPVRHYGGLLEANAGVIKATGKPEALDFIYKVGLGSRRSEGFGMLEMVG